jgi:transposase InsO family protein
VSWSATSSLAEAARKEAERALEAACIDRVGTLRPDGDTPMLRSDNGLIFQSRRFRAACRDYRLRQEFTTPYTPGQNHGRLDGFNLEGSRIRLRRPSRLLAAAKTPHAN